MAQPDRKINRARGFGLALHPKKKGTMKMTKTNAYCYATGEIMFGAKVPGGALPIRLNASEEEIKKINGIVRFKA